MAISTLERPLLTVDQPVVQTRMERQRAVRRRHPGPFAPLAVAVLTLIARLATAATGPTDWDSAQFASATRRFDVSHGQPQPPGYWLYVQSGRLVHLVTGVGVIHSLVVVSAVASAAAAGTTVVAGRDLGGRWVGVAAGLVVAASPFAWFSGSIASTYAFDMLTCSLLLVMAWRARPGSWHGIGAVVALGLLAGFRTSIVESFLLLVVIAVIASTKGWSRLATTVIAGLASVAVWFIPMCIAQPGGLPAWWRATHTEATGAAQATSIFVQASAGRTNLGTFGAYTIVALAPLAVFTVLAGVALLARAALGSSRRRELNMGQPATPTTSRGLSARWRRPWFQSRWVILTIAMVPAMLLVALIQFAKGGYLLAYLPAAVIALLLPLGSLNRTREQSVSASPAWLALTSLAVAVVTLVGAERFVSGAGILPQRWVDSPSAGWIGEARYQAPYPDTRATIGAADSIDSALAGLGSMTSATNDLIVFDTVDGGSSIYRNAGWQLFDHRVALISPNRVLYNELDGALYYASGSTAAVGPAGSVFLVASPALPGLADLVAGGEAVAVSTPQTIGDYRVYQILPGVSILGVQITEDPGVRPLGSGI